MRFMRHDATSSLPTPRGMKRWDDVGCLSKTSKPLLVRMAPHANAIANREGKVF
jgi:hypothetical protein